MAPSHQHPSFASFGYTYNPVGNLLAILDQVNPAETRNHTYDVLQRLKTGGTTSNTESYAYDWSAIATSFLSTTHTNNDLNRLLEDDQFLYTYDNNGNLATKTNKTTSAVTTYQWDAQDQLIQIDLPNSTTVTYKYDGLGRRIEKNVAGTITRYIYDGQDILLEYDGTNTFLARYSHGDQVDQPLILQKGGVGFFYYHANHQGSITHLTNSSGTVANSYVYDSYGRRLAVAESVIQPFSYTGREYDGESGLYFYRARYFDATTGRFLSEDPIGFASRDQNLYRYVHNSPIILVDPDGTVDTGWPYRPNYDPGIGGGASGYGGGGSYRGSRGAGRSGKSSTSPDGGPESPGKKQARDFTEDELGKLAERLGERAREKIDDLGDAIDRARERMNKSKPDNPESEIICPRGSICEKKPKDNGGC